MSDYRTVISPDGTMGWALTDGALTEDATLETAVLISLFTDARAEAGQVAAGDDPRGWWGDTLADDPREATGSRLWLLEREPLTRETLRQAEEYAEAALQWLITEGLASAVRATATRSGDALGLDVEISRPEGVERYTYSDLWGF